MTITIGRCGLDIPVDEVESVVNTGNSIQIAGVLYSTTVADAIMLRQQLVGCYDNPDEPIIPVTWSDDSSVDGFYKVTAVSVGTIATSLTSAWFTFSISLDRVHGTTIGCLAEAMQTVALRTNPHGVTTASWVPQPWVSSVSPLAAFLKNGTSSFAITGAVTRLGESTVVTTDSSPAALYPGQSVAQINVSPSQWYTAACRVEIGSSFRYAVGRDIVNDLTNWRISNGLVRLTANASDAAQLDIQWHNGTSWSATKSFALTYGGASYTSFSTAPKSVHVERNSPERVTVRVATNAVVIDLSIRRGSRLVEATISFADGIGTLAFGIKRTATEAATALTGGIRATSNDGDTNRYVISGAGSGAITNDLVNGRMYVSGTAPTSWQVGIGSEVGGSGATGLSAAQSIVYQYLTVWNETLRVVSR